MEKELFRSAFRSIKGDPFAVTYWDGQTEIHGAAAVLLSAVGLMFTSCSSAKAPTTNSPWAGRVNKN